MYTYIYTVVTIDYGPMYHSYKPTFFFFIGGLSW